MAGQPAIVKRFALHSADISRGAIGLLAEGHLPSGAFSSVFAFSSDGQWRLAGGIANTVAGQRRTHTVFPCITLRRWYVDPRIAGRGEE